MRPQKDAAQRGGEQGQCVDRRQEHRDGNGDGRIAEKSSPEIPGMNATGTNTDRRTRVIAMIGAVISAIARFDRIPGRQLWVFLHNALDIFDDDDRIIDDNAIARTDGEQGNGVGGVSDRVEHDEGADQADRNGQGWGSGMEVTTTRRPLSPHNPRSPEDSRPSVSFLWCGGLSCLGSCGRTLIPTLAVPVSLIRHLHRASTRSDTPPNTVSLLAIVLAIGIVVDDCDRSSSKMSSAL